MKLENQVVSLELAKRLKELGVKQESYFFWVNDISPIRADFKSTAPLGHAEQKAPYLTTNYGAVGKNRIASAFSVAELGELMKDYLVMTYPEPQEKKKWLCALEDAYEVEDDIEVEARAKMLIYLLENKLINS